MMKKLRRVLTVLTALALLAGLTAVPAVADAADAQDSFDTNYGFVAMNESSKITLNEADVWLTAKAATKGDIFDYMYKTPIDPNDFELDYTVVNDTTRDNGTHSRFNVYILPAANAAPSDGVKIQLIQFALGADNDDIKHTVIVGSGPDGGWSNYAHFNDDYSANLKLYLKDGQYRLAFNDAEYTFSGANAELLKSFAANGKAYLRLSAHYQENGESAYGGDYALRSIKTASGTVQFGTKYGTQEDRSSDIGAAETDKFEGVYGDDIKGKLEFTRFDYNSLTPEGTTLDYSVTEQGLALFGRNDANGFASGVSYQQPLTVDHDTELTFTLRLPDEVYSYNSNKCAEYSVFVCEAANVNFSETRSLYLRLSFRDNGKTVSSASPALLEVIMWDNADERLVVADNTAVIQPKTEAGAEHEFTFRIVFDAAAGCYKLYVNGQRASTGVTELSMTNYFDNIMAAKFLSCTTSYTIADRTAGGWDSDDDPLMGFTLKSINGLQLVNEHADVMETLELAADPVAKDTVRLSWSEAEFVETDFDASLGLPDGYLIKRLKGTVDADGMVETQDDGEFYVDGLETTDCEDKGLTPDTRYFYTVFAVKNNGDGNYTELLCSYSVRAVTPAEGGESGTATDAPSSTAAPTGAADNTADANATQKPAATGDAQQGKKKSNALPLILGIGGAVVVAAAVAVIAVVAKKKKG
ncbi:MAG: fibronectin type III domain-containing protein [Clostridia bacterium]|nr:fibronectin type III domain-containing protein [Clostridia bacterium]